MSTVALEPRVRTLDFMATHLRACIKTNPLIV
jgi:hypothetical protein